MEKSGSWTGNSETAGTFIAHPPGLPGPSAPAGAKAPRWSTRSITIDSAVAVTMAMRIAPGTLRTHSTNMSSSPATNTKVGQPVRDPSLPSWTGVPFAVVTNFALYRPRKAMNSPMPTAIAVLRKAGTASKTALRKPLSTSSRMTTPSMTTRPMAPPQVMPGSGTTE